MSRIDTVVKDRILVLDGAMGTMIQQYGLAEEDFRGKRFAGAEIMMKGNKIGRASCRERV